MLMFKIIRIYLHDCKIAKQHKLLISFKSPDYYFGVNKEGSYLINTSRNYTVMHE